MRRTWISGLAIAGVIGSGSAAIAGVVRSEVIGADQAAASPPVTTVPVADAPPDTRITEGSPLVTTYDVGGAGRVDLAVGDTAMTVEHAAASEGWSLLDISGDTTTVQVRFTDVASVVTFQARLVDGAIATAVEQVAVAAETAPVTEPVVPATSAAHPPTATVRPLRIAAPIFIRRISPRMMMITGSTIVGPRLFRNSPTAINAVSNGFICDSFQGEADVSTGLVAGQDPASVSVRAICSSARWS